jgi:single-stranded DNA-binding protein
VPRWSTPRPTDNEPLMNEITVHANLTADPVLREGKSGNVFLTFHIAVNRS